MARAPNQNFMTPGTRAAPAAEHAAEQSASAPPADDDLEAYESDELPPAPAGEVQMLLAQQQATIKRLARRLEAVESTKADKHGKQPIEEITVDEAKRLAEEDVRAGRRPRSRLTPEGWYVHPEMARARSNI